MTKLTKAQEEIEQTRKKARQMTDNEIDLAIFGQCFQSRTDILSIFIAERDGRTGGYCDCGNPTMKESKFCKDCI